MSGWSQVSYEYNGTLGGFLSCVFESYLHREEPLHFSVPGEARISLFPPRTVTTDPEQVKRVWLSLGTKISGQARLLISRGFLTCLPEKEVHLWQFIRLGYALGPGVMNHMADPRVSILWKAVGHMGREVEHLKGFVRFSAYENDLLVGEIEPKNRVLPLLRAHFCNRFSGETFVLHDRTHREALFHRPGQRVILPVDDFTVPPPGEEELCYRRLWRRFYDAIAIEGRINPKLRMTHMPKRYWNTMTEFQADEAAASAAALPALPRRE